VLIECSVFDHNNVSTLAVIWYYHLQLENNRKGCVALLFTSSYRYMRICNHLNIKSVIENSLYYVRNTLKGAISN
jgi:hypothetical protein